MTLVSHNFEGGTDGVALTAGVGGNTNLGGSSFFDGVDRVAGGVVNFAKASAYEGVLGLECGSRATPGICAPNWQGQFGTVTTDHFGGTIFKTDAIPATNGKIIALLNTALGEVGYIRLLASGALDIFSGVASIATSSTILLPRHPYRIEYQVHPSATVSYMTVWIYSDPTAPIGSPTEVVNAGGASTWAGATDTGYVAHGYYDSDANWPSSTGCVRFDAITAGAPSQVGPLPTWNRSLPILAGP